jgi:hypothetical protein
LVNARARRTALIVASVPLDTNRIISRCGMRSRIASASSTSSSVGIPKLVPDCIVFSSASSTIGEAWPSASAPQDRTKSMYSFPSASQMRGPSPRAATTGSPPTPPNARTGEFTPPGKISRARSITSLDRNWMSVVIYRP